MSTISDRFKKLYAELDELRELVSGSSVTELEGKVSEAELEFIRVEVVPYLAKIAGEKLASLRCDVDLTLKYRQGKGMEYSFAVSSTGGMKRGEGNTIAPPNDVKQSHDKGAPIKETLVKETPIKENPAKDIPAKEIPIKGIPVKATPAKATPVETSGKLSVSNPESKLIDEVDWINRICGMKSDKSGNLTSPQKGMLMIAIIDLISTGVLTENKIYFTSLLWNRYSRMWSRHVPQSWGFSANVLFPFTQLNEESFYFLVPNSRANAEAIKNKKNWDWGTVSYEVAYSKLDDELFGLLQNKQFAKRLTKELLSVYIERQKKEVTVVRPQVSTPVSEKRPRVKVDNAVPQKGIVREPALKSDVSEIGSEEVVMRRQPRRIEDVKLSRKFVSKSEMCQLWIEELMEMECEQKGCYMAPHKAIFMLTILYLIQSKKLRMNKIFFDQTLWGCYRMLWEKYVPEDWGFEPDVVDAYTSLNGELYYRLVASIPKNADLVRVKKDWTHISVTALVAYSEIDDELFSILCIDKYCDSVRDAIVDKYITKQTRRYERMFIEDDLDDAEEEEEEIEDEDIDEEEDDYDVEDYWIPADFEEYLASVKSPDGLPYSEEWVARKLSLIKDEYLQSMLEKHFDASHVDELESIGEIDKLISKVRWGVIMWQVDEDFVIALRLYREYRLMRQDA